MNRTKIISVPFERNNEMNCAERGEKELETNKVTRPREGIGNTGVNSRGTLMGHGNTSPMVSRGPSLILE